MKKTFPYVIICLVLSSCIDWDYFSLSDQKQILNFQLEQQSGTTVIDTINQIITVPVNDRADRSALSPTSIDVSSLASVEPAVGQQQDFRDTIPYTVTAEDGTSSLWKVYADLQADVIPNSTFDTWYTVANYEQPGPGDASSGGQFWDTGNKGASIAGDYLVNSEILKDSDLYAKMETKMVGLFGIEVLSAGSIFSGTFTSGTPNPNKPRSNITFGRPFGSKPSSFKVDYTYIPGSEYIEGNTPGPGYDQCDIYIILQIRKDDGTRLRLGTAWFRSSEQQTEWNNLEVDFIYGELPSGSPEYTGLNTWEGEEESGFADASEYPTHIIIVFSSSAYGDYFTGAKNSILTVNNFDLIYDN